MSIRDKILSEIAMNKPSIVPLPSIPSFLSDYDMNKTFKNNLLGVAGKILSSEDISQLVKEKEHKLFTTIPNLVLDNKEIEKISKFNKEDTIPDTLIVQGTIAVAENGAIWIEQNDNYSRILPFICEHLIIRVPMISIVQDMHEAYKILASRNEENGFFMSGPSKTADIEQVLVIGAQGPRTLSVILT